MTYLAHHGVKLQKWGVRRYQNTDGSLTEEGREHYGVGPSRLSRISKAVSEGRIRRTKYKLDKNQRKMTKAKGKLETASDAERQAAGRYYRAKDKYNKTASKLNRAENGLGAKLIGVDGYKVNRLQGTLAKDRAALSKATSGYDSAAAKALERQLAVEKLSNLDKRYNSRMERLTTRYIDKYGQVAYDELTRGKE